MSPARCTAGTVCRRRAHTIRTVVRAPLQSDVDFAGYDALGEGQLTALFVIHAGRGAEVTGSADDIWSHKWQIPGGVRVLDDPATIARTYLTVPEDCEIGVCAHEWGHLAARWADYYDTGRVSRSNGLGQYCLMASGSWGNGGLTPTLPNGMLRTFHDWIDVTQLTETTKDVELRPAADGGGVVLIQNRHTMTASQYVVVEYRRMSGQDRFLTDQGIAVYVIDEAIDNVNDETNLAIELMQADGKRDLAKVLLGNRGDSNDLYPSLGNKKIGQNTTPPLDLPDGTWSGIAIRVKGNPGDDVMKIDVKIA